jgi:hypothetical protein
MMDVVKPIPPLYAQVHPVDRSLGVGRHPDHAVIDYVQIELAPDAAVGTGRRDPAIRLAQADRSTVRDRPGWAIRGARSAPFACSLLQRNTGPRLNVRFVPALGQSPDEPSLDFVARANAPRTENALVEIDMQKRAGVRVHDVPRRLLAARLDLVFAQQLVQFGLASVLGRRSESPLSSQQTQYQLPGCDDLRRMRANHSPRSCGLLARRNQPFIAVQLDQADAARSDVAQVGMMAECRNPYPDRSGRLQDRLTFDELDRLVVDQQVGHGDLDSWAACAKGRAYTVPERV